MRGTEVGACAAEHLSALRNNFARASRELSVTKYKQIKVAVKELAGGCRRDERLPSIRAIGDIVGAGPVPVQRAVTELVAEGVLYVKNGVGLFVKTPPEKVPSKFTGHHTMRKIEELSLLFHAPDDANRTMMLRAVDKFRERNLSAKVKLLFEPSEEARPDMAAQFDSASRFLDLTDFAGHEIARGNLTTLGKHGGPLAYLAYYLFYNEALLAETGIAEPSYQNFEGQEAYIRDAKRTLESKGRLGPVSWNRPQYFLGRRTLELLDFLKGTEPADGENGRKALALLSKIIDYYRLFTYDGNVKCPALEAFRNAQTPLFAGYTNCLSQLECLDFKWRAYPLFACDDTLPLEPLYATVDAETQLPMECVKLLIYLQSPEAQAEFYQRDYITIRREGKYIDGNPAHAKAARESFSGYREESVDNYLFDHILDAELVECETRRKDIGEAFENIFHYSRGYMRNFHSSKP